MWMWASHLPAVEVSPYNHAILLVSLNLTLEFPVHLPPQWNFPVSPVRINDNFFWLKIRQKCQGLLWRWWKGRRKGTMMVVMEIKVMLELMKIMIWDILGGPGSLQHKEYGSCLYHVNNKQYFLQVGCHTMQRPSWDGMSSLSLGYSSRIGINIQWKMYRLSVVIDILLIMFITLPRLIPKIGRTNKCLYYSKINPSSMYVFFSSTYLFIYVSS